MNQFTEPKYAVKNVPEAGGFCPVPSLYRGLIVGKKRLLPRTLPKQFNALTTFGNKFGFDQLVICVGKLRTVLRLLLCTKNTLC